MSKHATDTVTKRNAISVAALNLYTCEARLMWGDKDTEEQRYNQRRYEDAKARMRELLNDGA